MPEIVLPAAADVLELLPPAGAALLLVALGAWLGRRGRTRWFAALAVAAASGCYAWTFVRLRGAPAVPPVQSTERAFFAVLAAAVLALLPAVSGVVFKRRAGLQIVAALAAVLLVAGGIESGAIKPWPLAAAAAGAIACFVLLDLASFRPAFPLAVAVSAGALGQVFVMFGGALLGQLAGATAILMALAAVACALSKQRVPAPAAMPVAAIVVTLAVDAELFMYQPPPLLALILLASGPLALLAIPPAWTARLGALKGAALGLLLALAVTGLGFFLAWREAPEPWG